MYVSMQKVAVYRKEQCCRIHVKMVMQKVNRASHANGGASAL